MPSSSVILILNHVKEKSVFDLYREIDASCGREHDVFLLSDRTRQSVGVSRGSRDIRELRFTTDDLIALGYPGKQDIVLPGTELRAMKLGNAELPVLLFFRRNPSYRHYWIVEYDVRYTGAWNEFFGAFVENDADLLGTSLVRYAECPSWSHWNSFHLPPGDLKDAERLRGFFPVYRLSNAALACLHGAYLTGCRGHMETLVPTVLAQSGFSLEDIGGDGAFVNPRNLNRYYTNRRATNDLSPGTFVYRPVHRQPGFDPGKLWHPVKPKQPFATRAINRLLRELGR